MLWVMVGYEHVISRQYTNVVYFKLECSHI
jgi:hypothetical protein